MKPEIKSKAPTEPFLQKATLTQKSWKLGLLIKNWHFIGLKSESLSNDPRVLWLVMKTVRDKAISVGSLSFSLHRFNLSAGRQNIRVDITSSQSHSPREEI